MIEKMTKKDQKGRLKNKQEKFDSGKNLEFSSNDCGDKTNGVFEGTSLKKAIILSEILGKPKAKR